MTISLGSPKKISTFTLMLLITGAIDSVRNLTGAALFGSELIFFFIFSALVFLIPVALVSAELSAAWSEEEGGIYSWVNHAFGGGFAFFTVWLQWINTLVWYPTILSFIAGVLAYITFPELAQNKLYLIAVILIIFWSLTLISLRGLHVSAAFAGVCAVLGMLFPIGCMIIFALIWVLKGNPIAIDLHPANLLPRLTDSQSWVSLTAIMTSFLGMELAAVHVRQVRNPQRSFPRAMLCSISLILVSMILGSLSIAFVLPKDQITLVDGVIKAFHVYCEHLGLNWLVPIMGFLLLLGSLGSMINWVIAPAKGLFMAAKNDYLPPWMTRVNQHGMPSGILLAQAVVVTFLCSGFLLFRSVNAIYWLFTALSTELYMIMYLLMFFAALALKRKFAHIPRPFKIPGGKMGYDLTCVLGLIGCVITCLVGFIPPSESVDFGGAAHFSLVFSIGIVVMVLPAVCLWFWKNHAAGPQQFQ